jgi:ElaB/YqjD/DUF883 family membrane-anchored ribosome-binding protein
MSMTSDFPGQSSGESGGSATARASEATSAAVEQAKQESRALVDEVRERAHRESDAQTKRVASNMHAFADQLTEMADNASDPEEGAARLTREAGQRLDRMAERVDQRGIDGLADDARRMAASKPLTYIAVAAGAGFLVGRFLRNAELGSIVDADRSDDSRPSDSPDRDDANGERAYATASDGLRGGAHR